MTDKQLLEKYMRENEKMKDALQKIYSICENPATGVKGATWGDTEMDSEAVVFGFNLSLDMVSRQLTPIRKLFK